MAGTLPETLICVKLSFKDFWSYYIKSSIAVKISIEVRIEHFSSSC